jgi:hypothetical protein
MRHVMKLFGRLEIVKTLGFSILWRCMLSFTFRPFYIREKILLPAVLKAVWTSESVTVWWRSDIYMFLSGIDNDF